MPILKRAKDGIERCRECYFYKAGMQKGRGTYTNICSRWNETAHKDMKTYKHVRPSRIACEDFISKYI